MKSVNHLTNQNHKDFCRWLHLKAWAKSKCSAHKPAGQNILYNNITDTLIQYIYYFPKRDWVTPLGFNLMEKSERWSTHLELIIHLSAFTLISFWKLTFSLYFHQPCSIWCYCLLIHLRTFSLICAGHFEVWLCWRVCTQFCPSNSDSNQAST